MAMSLCFCINFYTSPFYFLNFQRFIIELTEMKRLRIDFVGSEGSNRQQPKDVFDGRRKSSSPPKELKISVITNKESVVEYLRGRREKEAGRNENMNIEAKGEKDTDSQRTITMDRPRCTPNESKQELKQATLKSSTTSLPPNVPQKPPSAIFPSELKSASDLKESFRERMRLQRERQWQNRQIRQLNQMFIIDRKLTSGQKELNIGETKVYFPYEPYQVQVQYMSSVLQALKSSGNAILQSPTGTGKTLCLLASVLSFVQKQFRTEKMRHNVIYVSRTHTQLKQVQKELAKTCYRPNMAIFASREQLCLKGSLALLKGREKIQACGKGVKLARRLKKENDGGEIDPKIMQAACEFHREREEMVAIGRYKLANKLVDIDIMKKAGREQMFCPYFYPIQTKDFTNLFIMPYNYLLDAYLLDSYAEIVKNSIIIFDQAHNVPEAACQGRSLLLETHHLDSALLQLNKLLSKFASPSLQAVRQKYDKEIKLLVGKIEDFKETFARFIEENINFDQARQRRDSQREEADVKVINKERTDFALFYLFCGGMDNEHRKEFQGRKEYYKSQLISRLILPIQEFTQNGVMIIEEVKETPDGVFSNFERVISFCLKVKTLLAPKAYKSSQKAWVDEEFNHFRLYVGKTANGHTVGMRCLVPWLTFKDILRLKPHSILLTSGTLKPLNMWQKELKMKFISQLVNRHVISQQQIAAKVVKAGPNKIRFTFTFDNLNKNKKQVYKDLIEFLIQAASRIPNGILLVFPSFKIQMDFKFQLMRSSKKERLAAFKDIIFEEKNSDIDMTDFRRKALSYKGAILAIICRGKVSEGIDFPDGMCRAVFVIGVPYPNIKDPFIMEKKNHLQNMASRFTDPSEAISGQQWYFMGTVRAVNQAVGRLIRHVMDYGMVFLLDTRYSDSKMLKELPNWITQSMNVVDSIEGSFFNQISNFYQRMKCKYPAREQEGKEESRIKVYGQQGKKVNALMMLMGNQQKRNISQIQKKRIQDSQLDF